MRGRAIYFYALKEDMIGVIKEVEKKLGGLQYAKHTIYKKPELEIYNSIEEITGIGVIKPSRDMFFVALKSEEFDCREIKLRDGGFSYNVEDKNGILKLDPPGIFEGTNCIIRGELSTIAETESRQLIFKEIKKALLKNMMYVGAYEYVGKSIIENKEKYRIPYGSPSSPPEYDLDISDLVWVEKGRKKK